MWQYVAPIEARADQKVWCWPYLLCSAGGPGQIVMSLCILAAWVALSGPATQWSRHRAWEPVSEHPGPMTDADTAVTYFMLQFTQLAILEYQIAIVLQRVKECMKCADK